jgi:23S rRNA pseudouridine2605 synthase
MPRPSGNKRDNDFRNEKKNKPSAEKPKRESRESESKRGTRGTSRNAPIRKSEPKATDKPKRAPKPWEAKEERDGKSRGGFSRGGVKGKFLGRRRPEPEPKKDDGLMRLNRFLSNAGIASRRDADKLIELGLVKVNGKVVTELGMKVDPRVDVVKYDDKNLKPEKLQYVILNKPKDYLTTSEDPLERKTVMHLIEGACKERIYPIGRLDRMTTGLLLFTNDGEMARRLTSPRNGFPKLYHVETIEKIRKSNIEFDRGNNPIWKKAHAEAMAKRAGKPLVKKYKSVIIDNIEYPSIKHAMEVLGIKHRATFYDRINRGILKVIYK